MPITIDELNAELNKYRAETNKSLNEEQKQFLLSARDEENPNGIVPWHDIVRIWTKYWGKINEHTLKARYYKLREEENVGRTN